MGSTPARCGEETLAQLVERRVDNAKVIGYALSFSFHVRTPMQTSSNTVHGSKDPYRWLSPNGKSLMTRSLSPRACSIVGNLSSISFFESSSAATLPAASAL